MRQTLLMWFFPSRDACSIHLSTLLEIPSERCMPQRGFGERLLFNYLLILSSRAGELHQEHFLQTCSACQLFFSMKGGGTRWEYTPLVVATLSHFYTPLILCFWCLFVWLMNLISSAFFSAEKINFSYFHVFLVDWTHEFNWIRFRFP